MKIAICIGQCSVGGVGVSTYILASGMRKAHHQADILATDGQPGLDYERARHDGWPVEAICIGERWLRRRLAITLLRLSTYDIVINNHSIETELVLPALPAHIIRLSVIRSTNDPVISDGKSTSHYLDALVGISPEVQRLLKAAKAVCRTEMIANSVIFRPGPKPKLKVPLELAYLGRLTNIDKNILILPEIAKACNALGLKFTLNVVGDGKDGAILEKQIEEFGLTQCVKMGGSISHKAVIEFMRKQHFGIFPSNYEGFGLALVESMAAGCVPIGSDIPAYRWILGEDADTLLVAGNDAKSYAQRIYMLLTQPERYRQIQERLQRKQQEKFSPATTVNLYLELIDELKKTHDPGRFLPLPLANVPLPTFYRRRCTRAWWFLQKMKYELLSTS